MQSVDEQKQDAAIEGSLKGVAAGAACFPPYGTVAAAVIIAGIAIYDTIKGVKNTSGMLAEIKSTDQQKIFLNKALQDAKTRLSKRPIVPIDIYAGPPMYWIVDSEPQAKDPWWYTLTLGGDAKWPSSIVGGSTSYTPNVKPISPDSIYGSAPPTSNNSPSICIFFWAVPVFFARVNQLLGEFTFGRNYVGGALSNRNTLNKSETIDEYLSIRIKEMFKLGRLDLAGNWFGRIGTIIAPLASDDIDYAARYYGRSAWVHNLALQNIRYSDGTRIAETGLPYVYGLDAETQARVDVSKKLEAICKRLVFLNGTYVQQSGHIFDKLDLLSKYFISDKIFGDLTADKANQQDDTLYFVTTIKDLSGSDWRGDAIKWFDWGNTAYYNASTKTTDYYKGNDIEVSAIMQIISDAGGFKRERAQESYYVKTLASNKTIQALDIATGTGGLISLFDKTVGTDKGWQVAGYCGNDKYSSSWHGAFALAPYSLFLDVQGVIDATTEKENPGVKPRPVFHTYNSSYVFHDFIPTLLHDEYVGLPGRSDDYDWLRKLAIMPDAKPMVEGYEGIRQSGTYCRFNWSYSAKYDGTYMFATASMRYYSFNANLVTKFAVANYHDAASHGWNSKWSDFIPKIYEIVKLRPPLPTEQTITLSREYFGCAEWAYAQGDKANFAVVEPQVDPGYKLAIFKFNKNQQSGTGKKEAPLTRAYYRTNLSENKPIVELTGKSSPSPFYCGRRADARLLPAIVSQRLDTTGNGLLESNDTGWEDCHEWSWPYRTSNLQSIGIISKDLHKKYGEGIGRAGCSPSSIATGPTLWGDLSLYSLNYTAMQNGLDPNPDHTAGYKRLIANIVWTSMIEMQAGIYARYARLSDKTLNVSLSDATKNTFNNFQTVSGMKAEYLARANSAKTLGEPLQFNGKNLTPDEAANLAMQISDEWFSNVIPHPTEAFNKSVGSGIFNYDIMSGAVSAHIELKNWALDQGRQNPIGGYSSKDDTVHTPAAFPDNFYQFSAKYQVPELMKEAIASYNEAMDSKLKATNPIAMINNIFHSEKDAGTASQGEAGTAGTDGTAGNSKMPIVILSASALVLAGIILGRTRR